MKGYITKSPKLSALVLAIALVQTSAHALENFEKLEDGELADATGEGIAFLPENFSVRMNGIDNNNSGEGTYGTGYLRIIPVGPLSAAATAKGYQKADGWIYGLSLAQSKKNLGDTLASTDWGVPFGAIGGGATDFGREITSWGTAANPWIFKTITNDDVPNFAGVRNSVTYMTFEAPRFDISLPSSGTPASSAYNLKLGTWMDFATRTQVDAENGYDGLGHRLRLAAVWDGFSINGSNLNIFQTLDGVVAANGGTYNANLLIGGSTQTRTFNYGMSTSYNKTLGLSGLARLNSRATDTVRATTVFGNTTRQIVQLDYDPDTNWNTVTQTYGGSYSEGAILATNTVAGRTSGTMTAAVAGAANSSTGLTVSYNPMSNGSYRGVPNLVNPATAAQAAASGYKPSYYYRNASGGVVRGTFYDGGVCSSSTGGNSSGNNQFGQCLTQEGFTTRRFKVSTTNTWTPPPVRSVIRLSTQELSGGVFGAGTPALGGGTGMDNVPNFSPNTQAEGVFLYDANINLVLGNLYQPLMLSTDGNNFSIELARIPNVSNIYSRIYQRYPGLEGSGSGDPTITYLGSTCNIHQCGTTANGYQGYNATHSSITIGSTVYNAALNQLTAYKGLEAYGVSIGELKGGTGIVSSDYVDYVQVWKRTRTNFSAFSGDYTKVTAQSPLTNACTSGQTTTCVAHPSLMRPNPYETVYRQNYNNQVLGIQTTMPTTDASMQSTINNLMPTGGTVSNNFGSAVIDGLLIQHFKFSTTGL